MKYMKTLILLLIYSLSICAQNLLNGSVSSGVSFSANEQFFVRQNVGETFSGISSNEQYMVISGGIYNKSFLTTGVNSFINELPKKFSLEQNFPNPFNPETKIKFQLPSDVMVSLKIYNILGREVLSLIDQFMRAGIYNVVFSSRNLNLASGIYIYRLMAGDFISIRKMVLLK